MPNGGANWTFGGVLDHSDKDDVASAEVVLQLMKNDYVRSE